MGRRSCWRAPLAAAALCGTVGTAVFGSTPGPAPGPAPSRLPLLPTQRVVASLAAREPVVALAGVPVFLGPGADAAGPERRVSSLGLPEGERTWLVHLDASATDATVATFARGVPGGARVLVAGRPSEGGLPYLVLQATAEELRAALESGQTGSAGAVFVELNRPLQLVPELEAPAEAASTAATDAGASGPASWGLDRIDARWGLDNSYHVSGPGGAGVHVYVLDTGIRTTHVDFGGRATPAVDATTIPATPCRADNSSCAFDQHGHGTHVSGTIGSNTFGVAKNVSLYATQIADSNGTSQIIWFMQGLDWVVREGQRPAVISSSLGGKGISASIILAMEAAIYNNITVVVAAGNEGGTEEPDACHYWPSAAPAVITVGATTRSDQRASFSNIGPCLDIFAPGEEITSTGAASDTATSVLSGTSMACPHVSGAAALLLSEEPDISPAEVARRLLGRATTGATAAADAANGTAANGTAAAAAAPEFAVANRGDGSPDRLLYVGPAPEPLCPASGWWVRKGSCTVGNDSCVSSPNYPRSYGPNEMCSIAVCGDMEPVWAVDFDTEPDTDYLIVNGLAYSGPDGPAGIVPERQLNWAALAAGEHRGWKLCPFSSIDASFFNSSKKNTTATATTTIHAISAAVQQRPAGTTCAAALSFVAFRLALSWS